VTLRELMQIRPTGSLAVNTNISRTLAELAKIQQPVINTKLSTTLAEIAKIQQPVFSTKLSTTLAELSTIQQPLASTKIATTLAAMAKIQQPLLEGRWVDQVAGLAKINQPLFSAELSRTLAEVAQVQAKTLDPMWVTDLTEVADEFDKATEGVLPSILDSMESSATADDVATEPAEAPAGLTISTRDGVISWLAMMFYGFLPTDYTHRADADWARSVLYCFLLAWMLVDLYDKRQGVRSEK
jgi:hypothetical protein